MKLNHINLCTSNVRELSKFLIEHFAYHVLETGTASRYEQSSKGEIDFAMLDGADGSSLVLTNIVPPGPASYPTNFHFGIMMDQPLEVRAKHQELVEAGYSPESVKCFLSGQPLAAR